MSDDPYRAPASPIGPGPGLGIAPPHASGKATASLLLGVGSIFLYCVPPICVLMATTGIVLGVIGCKARGRGRALVGIGLSILALGLTCYFTMFYLDFVRDRHW